MALLTQMLYRLRIQVIAYGLGLAVWAAAIAFIFPSVQSSIGELEYPQAILDAFGVAGVSLADPRGFFGAEFFSLGPLVLGAFVVFASTAALAGEESGGTMEMLAALPVGRRSMFIQKAIAVLIAAIMIIALTTLGWAASVPFVDLGRELTIAKLVGGTFAQVPFAAFMIAAGLLFGAVAPSRSTAAACTGGLLIIAYLIVAIGSAVESIEDVRYASPYYYADLQGVLIDGVKVEHQLVLWATTLVVFVLALVAFEGRELGGERWQLDALAPRIGGGAVTGPGGSGGAGHEGAPRTARPPRGGRLGAVLVVIALGAATLAGVLGYRYVSALPPVVSITGRVDAASATILAPVSGNVSVLTAAEQQEVRAGDVLAWMVNTLDQTSVPITAPRTGRITTLELKQGQFAAAGAPVFVIHELGALYVALEVDEGDIDHVRVGQTVDLSFTALGITRTERVGFVASIPTANPAARPGQSRKYEARVPLSEADPRILVGQPVEAKIHIDAAR